jgi:hypothetical protein
MAEPSRHLTKGDKRAKYVPAANTDIRRTFRKARLLALLRQRKEQ